MSINFDKFGKKSGIELDKLNAGMKKSDIAENNAAEKSIFDAIDTDKNGVLDAEEIKNFKENIDTDNDNTISKSEAAKYFEAKELKNIDKKEILKFLAELIENTQDIKDVKVLEKDGKKIVQVEYNNGTIDFVNEDKSFTRVTNTENQEQIIEEYTPENKPKKKTVNKDKQTTVTEYEDDGTTVQEEVITDNENNEKTTVKYENGKQKTKDVQKGVVITHYNIDENGNTTRVSSTLNEGDKEKEQITTYQENNDGTITSTTTDALNPDKKIVKTLVKDGDKEKVIKEVITEGDTTTEKTYTEDGCEEVITTPNSRTETKYNKDNNRVSQTKTVDGETYTIEYDGKGNTVGIIVQNRESISSLAQTFNTDNQTLIDLNQDKVKGNAQRKFFNVGEEITVPGELDADNPKITSRKTKEATKEDYRKDEQRRVQESAKARAAEIARIQAQLKTYKKVTWIEKKANTFKELAQNLYKGEGVTNPTPEQIQARINDLKETNPNIKDGELKGKRVIVRVAPKTYKKIAEKGQKAEAAKENSTVQRQSGRQIANELIAATKGLNDEKAIKKALAKIDNPEELKEVEKVLAAKGYKADLYYSVLEKYMYKEMRGAKFYDKSFDDMENVVKTLIQNGALKGEAAINAQARLAARLIIDGCDGLGTDVEETKEGIRLIKAPKSTGNAATDKANAKKVYDKVNNIIKNHKSFGAGFKDLKDYLSGDLWASEIKYLDGILAENNAIQGKEKAKAVKDLVQEAVEGAGTDIEYLKQAIKAIDSPQDRVEIEKLLKDYCTKKGIKPKIAGQSYLQAVLYDECDTFLGVSTDHKEIRKFNEMLIEQGAYTPEEAVKLRAEQAALEILDGNFSGIQDAVKEIKDAKVLAQLNSLLATEGKNKGFTNLESYLSKKGFSQTKSDLVFAELASKNLIDVNKAATVAFRLVQNNDFDNRAMGLRAITNVEIANAVDKALKAKGSSLAKVMKKFNKEKEIYKNLAAKWDKMAIFGGGFLAEYISDKYNENTELSNNLYVRNSKPIALTKEQKSAYQMTVKTFEDQLNKMKKDYQDALDSQGVVSGALNAFCSVYNIGTTRDDIEARIKHDEETLKYLKLAAEGRLAKVENGTTKSVSFEDVFKERASEFITANGASISAIRNQIKPKEVTEFSVEKVEKVSKQAETIVAMDYAKDNLVICQRELNTALKSKNNRQLTTAIVDTIEKLSQMSGKPMSLDGLGYKLKGGIIVDKATGAEISADKLSEVAAQLQTGMKDVTKALFGVEYNSSINDSELEEILNSAYEKKMDGLKQEYREAFGQQATDEMIENYMKTINYSNMAVNFGLLIGATIAAPFTGGGSLAVFAATTGVSFGMNALEKSTDADGYTNTEWTSDAEQSLWDGALTALGFKVGQVADMALKGGRGFLEAAKQSNKWIAAMTAKLPADKLAKVEATMEKLSKLGNVKAAEISEKIINKNQALITKLAPNIDPLTLKKATLCLSAVEAIGFEVSSDTVQSLVQMYCQEGEFNIEAFNQALIMSVIGNAAGHAFSAFGELKEGTKANSVDDLLKSLKGSDGKPVFSTDEIDDIIKNNPKLLNLEKNDLQELGEKLNIFKEMKDADGNPIFNTAELNSLVRTNPIILVCPIDEIRAINNKINILQDMKNIDGNPIFSKRELNDLIRNPNTLLQFSSTELEGLSNKINSLKNLKDANGQPLLTPDLLNNIVKGGGPYITNMPDEAFRALINKDANAATFLLATIESYEDADLIVKLLNAEKTDLQFPIADLEDILNAKHNSSIKDFDKFVDKVLTLDLSVNAAGTNKNSIAVCILNNINNDNQKTMFEKLLKDIDITESKLNYGQISTIAKAAQTTENIATIEKLVNRALKDKDEMASELFYVEQICNKYNNLTKAKQAFYSDILSQLANSKVSLFDINYAIANLWGYTDIAVLDKTLILDAIKTNDIDKISFAMTARKADLAKDTPVMRYLKKHGSLPYDVIEINNLKLTTPYQEKALDTILENSTQNRFEALAIQDMLNNVKNQTDLDNLEQLLKMKVNGNPLDAFTIIENLKKGNVDIDAIAKSIKTETVAFSLTDKTNLINQYGIQPKYAAGLLALRASNLKRFNKIIDSGLLDLIKQGKIDESILKNIDNNTFLSNRTLKDIRKIANGESLITTLKNQSDVANIGKLVENGDVAEFNGKLYVNDNGKAVELKLSRQKFEELFPPLTRISFEQCSLGDCWFISTLDNLMDLPKGRVSLYQLLEQRGDDIFVKFPGTNDEIKFPNGKSILTPNNKQLRSPAQITRGVGNAEGTAEGILMIEQAYAVHRLRNGARAYDATSSVTDISKVADIEELMKRLKGGFNSEVLNEIFGTKITTDYFGSNVINRQKMKELIEQYANDENVFISFATRAEEAQVESLLSDKYDIYSSHAYAIKGYDKQTGMVYITNPWHTSVVTEVPIYELEKYMDYMAVAQFDNAVAAAPAPTPKTIAPRSASDGTSSSTTAQRLNNNPKYTSVTYEERLNQVADIIDDLRNEAANGTPITQDLVQSKIDQLDETLRGQNSFVSTEQYWVIQDILRTDEVLAPQCKGFVENLIEGGFEPEPSKFAQDLAKQLKNNPKYTSVSYDERLDQVAGIIDDLRNEAANGTPITHDLVLAKIDQLDETLRGQNSFVSTEQYWVIQDVLRTDEVLAPQCKGFVENLIEGGFEPEPSKFAQDLAKQLKNNPKYTSVSYDERLDQVAGIIDDLRNEAANGTPITQDLVQSKIDQLDETLRSQNSFVSTDQYWVIQDILRTDEVLAPQCKGFVENLITGGFEPETAAIDGVRRVNKGSENVSDGRNSFSNVFGDFDFNKIDNLRYQGTFSKLTTDMGFNAKALENLDRDTIYQLHKTVSEIDNNAYLYKNGDDAHKVNIDELLGSIKDDEMKARIADLIEQNPQYKSYMVESYTSPEFKNLQSMYGRKSEDVASYIREKIADCKSIKDVEILEQYIKDAYSSTGVTTAYDGLTERLKAKRNELVGNAYTHMDKVKDLSMLPSVDNFKKAIEKQIAEAQTLDDINLLGKDLNDYRARANAGNDYSSIETLLQEKKNSILYNDAKQKLEKAQHLDDIVYPQGNSEIEALAVQQRKSEIKAKALEAEKDFLSGKSIPDEETMKDIILSRLEDVKTPEDLVPLVEELKLYDSKTDMYHGEINSFIMRKRTELRLPIINEYKSDILTQLKDCKTEDNLQKLQDNYAKFKETNTQYSISKDEKKLFSEIDAAFENAKRNIRSSQDVTPTVSQNKNVNSLNQEDFDKMFGMGMFSRLKRFTNSFLGKSDEKLLTSTKVSDKISALRSINDMSGKPKFSEQELEEFKRMLDFYAERSGSLADIPLNTMYAAANLPDVHTAKDLAVLMIIPTNADEFKVFDFMVKTNSVSSSNGMVSMPKTGTLNSEFIRTFMDLTRRTNISADDKIRLLSVMLDENGPIRPAIGKLDSNAASDIAGIFEHVKSSGDVERIIQNIENFKKVNLPGAQMRLADFDTVLSLEEFMMQNPDI
ncbi:MAG: hypothetical protein ACI37Q_03685 [Candidatus Gastranaerophilaceae bacterium]